jgi:hypothetical protein
MSARNESIVTRMTFASAGGTAGLAAIFAELGLVATAPVAAGADIRLSGAGAAPTDGFAEIDGGSFPRPQATAARKHAAPAVKDRVTSRI